MKMRMQLASVLTLALLFSGCGSNSNEEKVEASSITPIEIPESDSGYKNFARSLAESNEKGIVIEDSYSFNTFLNDVEQQEGWEAKSDFLTAIKENRDFSNSNLMIYCVDEKPTDFVEASAMVTASKARVYIEGDKDLENRSDEYIVAVTSYLVDENPAAEPVTTSVEAEVVTTDLEVTTTEVTDTSVMPIAEESVPYCFSYAVDKELESVVIENNNQETVIHNRVEASSDIACTMEYMPVCGSYEVQCITEPCEKVEETFSNSCMAKAKGAEILYSGECGTFDFPEQCSTWYDGCNTCSKDENGNVACTEMYCEEPQGQMRCLD